MSTTTQSTLNQVHVADTSPRLLSCGHTATVFVDWDRPVFCGTCGRYMPEAADLAPRSAPCPVDIPGPAAVYMYRTGTYAMALDHRPDVADPRPLTADAQHRAYRDYHRTLADVPTADVDQTYAAVLTAIYGAPWPAGRAPVVGVRL